MATIGVRELKRDASRVLRRVRERGEEIEITHHGGVVARLAPVAPQRPRRPPSAAWSAPDRIAREIGARWPKGWSAARAVRDARAISDGRRREPAGQPARALLMATVGKPA